MSVETPIIANYLQPERIANVVWLCSPGADCPNGCTIMCDGGFASSKA